MLYLHGGWPRTGTTALQAALSAHADRLGSVGVVYPDRWREGTNRDSHHGLGKLVVGAGGDRQALTELRRYLDRQRGDVLVSAEGMTGWLRSADRRDAFLQLVSTAREVTPVRCIWTLRRFDRWLTSIYLLLLAIGRDLPPPEEYFAEHADAAERLFTGMKEADDVAGGGAIYLKYDPGGRHNRELLAAVGVPDSVAGPIEWQLRRNRRASSLSRKEASVLVNVDAISARTGVKLEPRALRRAFARGDFAFEDDGRCEPVEADVAADARERALNAATRGFAPYADFFAAADPDCTLPPGLGVENIDQADLAHLVSYLGS